MAELLGIDIGTTGARALVIAEDDGRVIASATSEYPLSTPRPLWAEQHPEDWWTGTVEAVRGAIAAAHSVLGREAEIRGIGLSGQMHGVTLLDGRGRVLTPAMLWCDGRTEAECREITDTVGAEHLITLVGNPALVGFSAPKLLWVRKHLPEIWRETRKFLLPKDYIRFRLTGVYASEVSDASGTLLFDVVNRRWSGELLNRLDLDPDWLPEVYESPVPSATVSAEAAGLLGLRPGTPVVGGGGDQAAGAVGAGIVEAGRVSVTVGSSGVVFAHAEKPMRDARGRVHTFCHAVPGAWHVMGVTQGAGLSLRWFRDEIFGAHAIAAARAAGRDPYDVITELAAAAPAGSDGLVYLPYLMGERTPHLDAQARGVYVGLTAAHRQAHLARAVMEGVAFSLRDCAAIFEAMEIPMTELRAAGGGARSALWRQIQADVLGKDVVTLAAGEGPAYGAALLAGVGVGNWKSVEAACSATIRPEALMRPDERHAAVYDRTYAIYTELYTRLAPVFPRLGAINA